MIALSIFFLTFLLEDAATSSAAVLAAEGQIEWEVALGVLALGIILGDFALYGLGKLLNKSKRVQSFFSGKFLSKLRGFVTNRVVFSILIARFIPGARFLTYTAMGALNVSFKIYALTVIFAVGIWTGILFYVIFHAGQALPENLGDIRYAGFAILILAGGLLPYIIRFVMKKLNIAVKQ